MTPFDQFPDWVEELEAGPGRRQWRHVDGAVVSLDRIAWLGAARPDLEGVRQMGRQLAEARGGGLIEVEQTVDPPSIWLIYKRRSGTQGIYTGMLFVRLENEEFVWTAVAAEQGMTGVREAIVTAELINSGTFTVETYPSRFRDPYQAEYAGVDRSCLRFDSDEEAYDARFPNHPLSRVRAIRAILTAERASSQ